MTITRQTVMMFSLLIFQSKKRKNRVRSLAFFLFDEFLINLKSNYFLISHIILSLYLHIFYIITLVHFSHCPPDPCPFYGTDRMNAYIRTIEHRFIVRMYKNIKIMMTSIVRSSSLYLCSIEIVLLLYIRRQGWKFND